MATRTLTVNLIGRADKLNRSFKNASRGADTMAGKMMKATRMAGLGFTALGGVAVGAAMALKPMIDKASDVQESLSKNNVVFGESARTVEQFAERSLQAFGVTRREALEATGVIGTLGATMGMAEADSADMATTLVGLAGDMASFNNASIDETLTAIQAGLRGENEPLRRFGVLLDAATLKAKALQEGIIKSTKEALTPQAKALAAYALILEQTGIQMGDFERTSDGAANQQRLLAGAWDDLQVQIGEKLLPAFTSLVTYANDTLMPALQTVIDMDWSEFTFDDLMDAMADANVDVIAFLTETGLNWSKALGDGMISQFKSRELEVGTREAITETLHDALGNAPGINIVTGTVLGLWQRIFGDGTEAATALQERLDALRIAAAVGDALDIDRGHDLSDLGSGGEFAGFGSVASIENSIAIAEAAAAAALEAAAGADEKFLTEAATEAAAEVIPDVIDDVAGEGRVPGGFEIDPALQQFLDVVGTSDWDRFMGSQGSTTSIVVNAPAVSGQEVVEAIGKYVDDNGPLPPHWQQTAG